ncbi:hypothetical protein O9G_005908, partial [Rozella allomycis CSF55]
MKWYGLDAFFFFVPVNRSPDFHLASEFNFISSLTAIEGYKQVFIIFTFADSVVMTEEEEKMKIDELRTNTIEIAPQAGEFLNSLKYLFYRDNLALDVNSKIILPIEMFITKAYFEVYENSEQNNGKTISIQTIIESKMKCELQMLQEEREQLISDFKNKVSLSEPLSADLHSLTSELQDKIEVQNNEVLNSMTHNKLLITRLDLIKDIEALKRMNFKYSFLESEKVHLRQNVTLLKNEAEKLVEEYNAAKLQCKELINECKKLRLHYSFLDISETSWYEPNYYCYRNYVRFFRILYSPHIEILSDDVWDYFRKLMLKELEIMTHEAKIPILSKDLPTSNDYMKYAKILTNFNHKLAKKTNEIEEKTEDIKSRNYRLADYPQHQILIDAILRNMPPGYPASYKEKLLNAVMLDCEWEFKPLNVLLLGYFGSGKSTIVNVLHGLFDLVPNDSREVAKSSNSMDSVTTECKGYDCSIDGVNLHVVDTPGFEDKEAKNNEVATLIADQVPKLLKDGIDAFFFLYPVDRACDSQLVNVFNFITSLITKEGFKQGFIVFTKADTVMMTGEDEQKKIEELKAKFMAVAPQAKEFLETVKYLFYRHMVAFGPSGYILFPEARRTFAVKAYSEILNKCVENNGKTFSSQAMINAKIEYEKMNQEIESYR